MKNIYQNLTYFCGIKSISPNLTTLGTLYEMWPIICMLIRKSQWSCPLVVFILLDVGKENDLMTYCFIKLTQVLVRVGISRPVRICQRLAEKRARERCVHAYNKIDRPMRGRSPYMG